MLRRERQDNARWPLLLFLLPLLAAVNSVQGENRAEQSGDRFSQLVQIVAASGENEQQDFSWIALSELTAAYESVFTSSGSETPKERRSRDRLVSWRSATRSYISELQGLLERLPGSVDIQMQADSVEAPVIYIDGTPIVLSGPEIGGVKLMEKRIIDTYCAMYDCGELNTPAGQQPEAVYTSVGGSWHLRNFGKASYVTTDGLIFTFNGLSERPAKQQVCEAFAAELRNLAAGLRDALDAGHRIDWDRLEIQPLAGGRGHRIQFNRSGEYLRLELPLLARNGVPAAAMLAWIRERATGGGESGEFEIAADPLLLQRSPE